jgi:acetolactate synthase regulatory subunit
MLPLPNDPCCSVHFELLADAEPGLLPRVLAPFAKRDLVPDQVHARREGTALLVEVGMEAMPSGMMHLVESNLRQIVGVRRVAAVLREERRWAA